MAGLPKEATPKCLSTNIILSGYSQGGMVSHYAALHGAKSYAAVLYSDTEDEIAKVGDLATDRVESFCGQFPSAFRVLHN